MSHHLDDASRARRVHHDEQVMGTVITIDVYLEDAHRVDDLRPLFDLATQDLHFIDGQLSLWKPDSAISQYRRNELSAHDLPNEVVEVLDACRVARELSRGWFDPWTIADGVDPTGYVKGWAAQRVVQLFRHDWIGGCIVNAAGDVAVTGSPAPGENFRVGIVNPFDRSQICLVAEVQAALATSGTYERGEHLIVPGTREAHSAVASASVSGPDLGLADALATAVAVGGVELLAVIDDLDGFEALVIDHEGAISKTPGFHVEAVST